MPPPGRQESVPELNERAALWLEDRVHTRLHRGMGEIPADRFAVEGPMLSPLPQRSVRHRLCGVPPGARGHSPDRVAGGVRYSVPPRCLGQKVEVRHEVDSSTIEIRWAGEVVGRHTVADPTTGEVWEATSGRIRGSRQRSWHPRMLSRSRFRSPGYRQSAERWRHR